MNFNQKVLEHNIKEIQSEIDATLPYYAALKHMSITDFKELPKYVKQAVLEKQNELAAKLKKLHLELAAYQEQM